MNQGGPVNERYDVGVDVGAIGTKVLLLRNGKETVGWRTGKTGMEPGKMAEAMVEALLSGNGLERSDIDSIIATGQGRRAVHFSDLARTEITAFAKGAFFLDPGCEVVVDIGGHGVRAMRLGEDGIVSDFRTNDKCSSGTGCFMDAMAQAMEIGIEEFGERSLQSKFAENVSASCTVFAESEVISLVAKGKRTEDILAGLNSMVAKRIVALVNSTQSHGRVFLCGGVALNAGVVKEIRDTIDREVFVPEHPEVVGALGAALLSPRKVDAEIEKAGPASERSEGKSIIGKLLRWSSR